MFKLSKDLSKIKNYLQGKKKAIEGVILNLKKEDPFADIERLIDNAASDTEVREQIGHQRIEVLKRQMERNLTEVQKALVKIRTAKYGICEGCDKPIEKKRLTVLPMAEFCLACEKKREK